MDKQKLFSLTKRLTNSKLKSMTPTNIYLTLMTEFPYNQIMTPLSPKSIISISFLIKYYDNNKTLEDVSKVIDNIEHNLFGFSVFEILSDEVEDECSDCSGSGRDTCYRCGGSGREECDSCDGTGEDEEGNTCDSCSGDGEVDCDRCDGDGELDCDYCDNTGYITNDDESDIYQYFFVSVNPTIRDFFIDLEEYDKITEETYHRIINDKLTIQLTRKSANAAKNWPSSYGIGDYIFTQYTDSPKMSKGFTYLDVQNLYDM